MKNTIDPLLPRYQQVKEFILSRIDSGELQTEMKIESENRLVELLGVSRMTVNRALRELTSEGRLTEKAAIGYDVFQVIEKFAVEHILKAEQTTSDVFKTAKENLPTIELC